jgi:UPF0755 protein
MTRKRNNQYPAAAGRPGFIVEPEEETAGPPEPGKIKTGPGCFSRLFGLAGIAVCVGLIAAFLMGLKYSVLFLPAADENREVVVAIPEGIGPGRIGEILEKAGVIKSAQAFVWTIKAKSRLDGRPVVLKAGEMALNPAQPVWKVIDSLVRGNYKLYPFTVPEGRNIFEIAQMIETQGLGSATEFLKLCRDQAFIRSLGFEGGTLEGYLFPETYNFPKGTPLKTIIKTMTDAFLKVWQKYETAAQNNVLTRHQLVTLASIVEKETGVPRERPLIAGLFVNRLGRGMKLQTDPTVIYGLLPGFNGDLTRQDLASPTPYNTYVIDGLPPGPITNPGEAALAAAVRPDIMQPYLYFVAKNDGTHYFSKTLAEHNRMVNQYQRGGRPR